MIRGLFTCIPLLGVMKARLRVLHLLLVKGRVELKRESRVGPLFERGPAGSGANERARPRVRGGGRRRLDCVNGEESRDITACGRERAKNGAGRRVRAETHRKT